MAMNPAFEKPQLTRTNITRGVREVADMVEEVNGIDKTQLGYDACDELQGMEIDPLSESVQRPSTQAMSPSGDDRHARTGKRTNDADDAPGMPGA